LRGPGKKYLNVCQAAFIGAGAMVGAGIFALLGAAGEGERPGVWRESSRRRFVGLPRRRRSVGGAGALPPASRHAARSRTGNYPGTFASGAAVGPGRMLCS
ncbi:MAG TPA: hypothetical protein VEH31_34755, partial [Streptosporangiaceae bacterium]|nr:hypothetical protein [Streptosporangiaceae bacterium]